MNLVFIYGLSGVGKLTVARELSKLTGYKLFHNHLVVDLVLSLFDFGSRPFIGLREKIWLMMFERASQVGLEGVIFTFAFESTVSGDFVRKVLDIVGRGNGETHFVKLVCSSDELKKRISDTSMSSYGKVISLELLDDQLKNSERLSTEVDKESFVLDNTKLSPTEAAQIIYDHIQFESQNQQ